MKSKNTDMQIIFSELSETNKDIIILLAKGMKVAQDVTDHSHESVEQTA